MEEKKLLKQFNEIAKQEGYVLLPKSYYERLFNNFAYLQTELKNARLSRDKLKAKLKDLKVGTENINKANSQEVNPIISDGQNPKAKRYDRLVSDKRSIGSKVALPDNTYNVQNSEVKDG